MAHHPQRLCGVTRDQNALALGQQMADQIANGMSFSSTWRSLHQNTTVLFELLCDSDLLRISRFAQQHFAVRGGGTARGWMRGSRLGNRRLFSNDIQQRPRQIFACAQVRKYAFNRSRKSQGARAQEKDWVASDARVGNLCIRRAVVEELSAWGKLDDQPLQKGGGGAIDQRMKAFLLQLFAASADRASIHIAHRLEQRRVQLNWIVRFVKREFGHRCVELQLQALQENRMINPTVRSAPTQDAISEDKLNALRLAIDAAVQRVERLEDSHRCASGLFRFCPFIAQKFPTLEAGGPNRIISERHNRSCCADFGFFQCRPDRECTRRIVPPVF